MRTTFITFRGEPDVAVEYHDHGYDPDTNTQEIDWYIDDDRFKDIESTQEEEDAIYNLLAEISFNSHERFDDDVI